MNTKLEKITENIIQHLKTDENVYVLIIDGWECYNFNKIKSSLSEEQKSRIINMGISEQNAVGFASGLSKAGKIVYLIMFAAFLTTRAYEQIKLDLGYDNANVKLIGIHGGFTGPRIAGYSHWAIEDLAIMNSVSNLTIFNPANSIDEIDCIMDYTYKKNGPVYIRLDNPGEWFKSINYTVKAGKLAPVAGSSSPDSAIIATGNMASYGIDLIKKLNKLGLNSALYSAHTIKPFDIEGLKNIISKNIPIITMEEHVQYGGLSSIVSEQIAINKSSAGFLPVCIKDKKYSIVLGDYKYALNHMLDADEILDKITTLVKPRKRFSEYIFSKKRHFDKKERFSEDYSILSVPILKKKSYTRNGIPQKSTYILGIKLPRKEIK